MPGRGGSQRYLRAPHHVILRLTRLVEPISCKRMSLTAHGLCTAPSFQGINNSDLYHEKWWYTSQLFDHDWIPRATLEHAPAAESTDSVVA